MSFRADFAGAIVRPSPNFGERRGVSGPDMIVLHYTGMPTGHSAEDWLCDPVSEVSSHYLLHEDGTIIQMVPEAARAWHAGASCWQGRRDINSASIGIEIVNPGHAGGLPPFSDRQIDALIELCRDIMMRRSIPAARILGHSDIAPARKSDPGEMFPWSRLGAAGVAQFVAPVGNPGAAVLGRGDRTPRVARLQGMLARYGYAIDETGVYDEATAAVVRAFQRRFRPARVDGIVDRSTLATLEALVED